MLRLLLPALVCAGCLVGGARGHASMATGKNFAYFEGGSVMGNAASAGSSTTCALTVAASYACGATGQSIGLSGSSQRIVNAGGGTFSGNRYGSTSYTWAAPSDSSSEA